MLKRFAAAWRFLTIFPFPMRPGDDEVEHIRRCAGMFPVVGLALGLGAGSITWLLVRVLPLPAAAAAATAILAFVSGCFHMDGLADSADAMLSSVHDTEKSLAIMRDSRIGAHGAAAIMLVLILKFGCLASLTSEVLPAAVAVAPLAGRAGILFPVVLLPYLRDKGLGKLFEIRNPVLLIAWGSLCTMAGMGIAWGLTGVGVGLPVWLAVVLLWVWCLKNRLGGATGDTYGATCELAETAACLAAAICMTLPKTPLPQL